MKLCHPTAVTLLGWYLMMPPVVSLSGHHDFPSTPKEHKVKDFMPVTDAPLTEWTNTGSYDTANECEAARLDAQRLSTQRKPFDLKKPPLTYHDAFLASLYLGNCIATDDPRLKGETKK